MRKITDIKMGNLKGTVYQDSDGLHLYKIRGIVNGKSMVINMSYVYYDTKEEAMRHLREAMECMTLQKDLLSTIYN